MFRPDAGIDGAVGGHAKALKWNRDVAADTLELLLRSAARTRLKLQPRVICRAHEDGLTSDAEIHCALALVAGEFWKRSRSDRNRSIAPGPRAGGDE